MEFFDLLILLAFLLFPLLQRMFGKKKPGQRKPGRSKAKRPSRETQPTGDADPFADALRQIREALGEQETDTSVQTQPDTLDTEPTEPEVIRPAAATSTPEAADASTWSRIPAARLEPPERKQREREFRRLGEFEHDAHGFGSENPLSEEVFEQKPAFVERGRADSTEQGALNDVDLTTPIEVKQVGEEPASRTSGAVARLRTRRSAREAFILKEILDRPRSLRR